MFYWKCCYEKEFKITVIGITGKTGCGKSSAAEYLGKKLNASLVLDVDQLSKKIYCKNLTIVKKITDVFGNEVIKNNGTVDFTKLGRIVFDDFSQMKKLNDMMFPLINESISELIKANIDKKYIIIDAAILFDAGLDRFCNKIIYLTANAKEREKFLKCKNSDLCIDDIRQRICNQKIKVDTDKIDYIINNDSSLEDLYKDIDTLIKKL